MPRKRVSKVVEKRTEDEDEDFFCDDSNSSSGRNGQEPQHRNAANARERARMRVLSKAFCRLKTTLPWVPADTKLSKLDTLRLAASYIAHLRALLHEPRSAHTPPHPLSMAWPFAFQHGGGSLSCTISQRWNVNHNTENPSRNSTSHVRDPPTTCPENYNYENDYDERCYEDNNMITGDISCETQYCNYGYKGDYQEMRNCN